MAVVDTSFFRDVLANGSEQDVRQALEHLVHWHEIYGVEMSIEYGIEANGDGVIYPCTELYVKGMENQPGVVVHQRRATGWAPKHNGPVSELTKGQQINITS